MKFKYLVNTTRKFALPLLDYFDRSGLLRRVGNTRYLKVRHGTPPPAAAKESKPGSSGGRPSVQ